MINDKRIKKLVIQYQKGNDDVFSLIVDEAKQLIIPLCIKYGVKNSFDDSYSLSLYSLWRCCNDYVPDDRDFFAIARSYIIRGIQNANHKRFKWNRDLLTIDKPLINKDYDYNIEIADKRGGSIENIVIKNEIEEMVNGVFNKFPDEMKTIIKYYFEDHLEINEIVQRTGKSRTECFWARDKFLKQVQIMAYQEGYRDDQPNFKQYRLKKIDLKKFRKLIQSGKSVVEIAAELKIPVGHVYDFKKNHRQELEA